MHRRHFLKTLSYLTCTTALTTGCNNLLSLNINPANNQSTNLPKDFLKNLKNDKFYYKSKKDLPKSIRLEACSLCQLKCPACTVRLLEKDAPKDWLGYLKFKDFKNFINDNPQIETIELSNNGEIFLNPELDEIIKYAHEKGIKLTATNGVNLNTVSEQTLENLVKYKFNKMTISIDGATPETYKIYRVGGDFNTVINNIKTINKFKKWYGSEFPRLTYKFILFGHNEHEIELAKKKARELGMDIRFSRNYSLNYSPLKNKKIANEIETSFSNRLLLGDVTCKKLFETPQIDYNGNLLGCCYVQFNKFKINVFKHGLLKALNSPDYIYAKHMVSDLSIPSKKEIPCTYCLKYKTALKYNITVNLN